MVQVAAECRAAVGTDEDLAATSIAAWANTLHFYDFFYSQR